MSTAEKQQCENPSHLIQPREFKQFLFLGLLHQMWSERQIPEGLQTFKVLRTPKQNFYSCRAEHNLTLNLHHSMVFSNSSQQSTMLWESRLLPGSRMALTGWERKLWACNVPDIKAHKRQTACIKFKTMIMTHTIDKGSAAQYLKDPFNISTLPQLHTFPA
ncbi:hypothetical protein Z043_102859, partial [Scleropages formosus]